MNTLELLRWRYATKKYNSTQKISQENLATLKEAVQLSCSSYGLQLYKVFIVENATIREKLQQVSWGQSQVVDASHLFVFACPTEVKNEDIDQFVALASKTRNISLEDLKGYADFMKNNLNGYSKEQKQAWMAKQTYIALGNLLTVAAELKIDATPMEGFEADKFDELLDLKSKGYHAVVMAAIGYRHSEDGMQHLAKVRKPINELFETI